MENSKVVGVGEFKISNDQSDILSTYALATCVAVTAYCPINKAAGMVHLFLPTPTNKNIINKPSIFASTGVYHLLNRMVQKYNCALSNLKIGMFGGASSLCTVYDVGKRNIEEVEKALATLNLKPYMKEIGGQIARSVHLKVGNGEITVFQHNMIKAVPFAK